jgi:hypothetical protein
MKPLAFSLEPRLKDCPLFARDSSPASPEICFRTYIHFMKVTKIVAIFAIAVAVGAAYYASETEKKVKALQSSFSKQHNTLVETETKLKKTQDTLTATQKELEDTKGTLAATEKDLADTKKDLADTKAKLSDSDTKLAASEAEVASLRALVQNGDLKAELEKLISEKARLEGEVQKLTTENAEFKTMVDALTIQRTELEAKVAKLELLRRKWEQHFVEKGLRGRIMAVNAGWNFVVLDIGDKQGAAVNKDLVVVRNGQGIGKVRITSVESRQSIADILPRSVAKGITIEPGDGVIYTGEDKPTTTDLPVEAASAPVTN